MHDAPNGRHFVENWNDLSVGIYLLWYEPCRLQSLPLFMQCALFFLHHSQTTHNLTLQKREWSLKCIQFLPCVFLPWYCDREKKQKTRKAKGMLHFFHFDCQTYYFPTERINTEIFIKAFSLHFPSHKSFYFRSHNTNAIHELCVACTVRWFGNAILIGSHGEKRAQLKTNFEIAFCQWIRRSFFHYFHRVHMRMKINDGLTIQNHSMSKS